MTPSEALQFLRNGLPADRGLDNERDTAIRTLVAYVDELLSDMAEYERLKTEWKAAFAEWKANGSPLLLLDETPDE